MLLKLGLVHAAAPDLAIGVIVPALAHDWRAAYDALSAATLHVGDRGLTAEGVSSPIAEGIEIGVYTVNDPARAKELLSWGIAGIFSDCPGAIAAAL